MATTVEKELIRLSRIEERLRRRAHKDNIKWKAELEAKIPEKVLISLQAVFKKAFEIIFDKGTAIIEKTYKKEEMARQSLKKHTRRKKFKRTFLSGIMLWIWI